MLQRQGFELLDHPMDYEIVREGDWYHDPGVPEGEITWHTFETTITLYKVQPTYLWFQHADQSADIYVDDVKVTPTF